MSTAPDLLEVVRAMLINMRIDGRVSVDTMDAARAALAKVEGKDAPAPVDVDAATKMRNWPMRQT